MRNENKTLLEKKVISSILNNIELLDSLDIDIGDFQPKYRDLLRAIKECWTNDPTILVNNTTVIWLDELRDIIGDTMFTTETDFQNYTQELKELITRDKLSLTLNNMILRLNAWGDSESVYSELNKLKLDWYKEEDNTQIIDRLKQQINWDAEFKIISTWYRDLDNLVWGYEKWQVVVIGARPWVWKSMLAINLIINNVRAWENVALFSLEMNKEQVYRRLLAMNSWVSVRKLKSRNEWVALEQANKWFDKLNEQLEHLYVFDRERTISEIERKIRQIVHKHWVSVVYLDYLQLIRNPSIKNNPIESLTDMSQRLKQLALELDITIVELSQLNREAANSVIKSASQLRGSGSIEQDADMIWILDKDDNDTPILRLSVQKCRDWRIGDIELSQISDIMLIKDKLINKPF